jgi:hypothetical protein
VHQFFPGIAGVTANRLFGVLVSGIFEDKGYDMGEVHTEITLVNIRDKNIADEGYMPQDQVRQLTVNALVDTGAHGDKVRNVVK